MSGKIQRRHLERRAYVYVRQSTAKQVFENTESTTRQYALAERARALGWSQGGIEIIDEDLSIVGTNALFPSPLSIPRSPYSRRTNADSLFRAMPVRILTVQPGIAARQGDV